MSEGGSCALGPVSRLLVGVSASRGAGEGPDRGSAGNGGRSSIAGISGALQGDTLKLQERSWVEGKRRIHRTRDDSWLPTLGPCVLVHGNTWFLWEHPLKTEGDFRIFEAYLDDIRIEPDYELLANAMAEHGEMHCSYPWWACS